MTTADGLCSFDISNVVNNTENELDPDYIFSKRSFNSTDYNRDYAESEAFVSNTRCFGIQSIEKQMGIKMFVCTFCDYETNQRGNLNRHVLMKHGSKDLSCLYCDYKTNHTTLLKQHVLSKHERKNHSCSYCEYSTNNKCHLNQHIITKHTKEKPFVCQFCGYETSQKSNLTRHISMKHTTSEVQCPDCDYRTSHTALLKQHILSKHTEKLFSCSVCQFRTSNSNDLQQHVMLKHTMEVPYTCVLCDYATIQKGLCSHGQFDISENTNNGVDSNLTFSDQSLNRIECNRNYAESEVFEADDTKCFVISDNPCGQLLHNNYSLAFAHNDTTQQHIKKENSSEEYSRSYNYLPNVTEKTVKAGLTKHADKKSMACYYCEYKTKHRGNLKRHIMVNHKVEQFLSFNDSNHNENFPILTEEREEMHNELSFKSSPNVFKAINPSNHVNLLKQHILSKHEGKIHFCPYCEYSTRNKHHLNQHISGKHTKEKPFICQFCGYETNQKCNLTRHITMKHTNAEILCPECEYRTSHPALLKQHMLSKHIEKNFSCSLCEFRTNITSHLKKHVMTKHTLEKPFKCELCNYATNQKGNLNRHISLKHSTIRALPLQGVELTKNSETLCLNSLVKEEL